MIILWLNHYVLDFSWDENNLDYAPYNLVTNGKKFNAKNFVLDWIEIFLRSLY